MEILYLLEISMLLLLATQWYPRIITDDLTQETRQRYNYPQKFQKVVRIFILLCLHILKLIQWTLPYFFRFSIQNYYMYKIQII